MSGQRRPDGASGDAGAESEGLWRFATLLGALAGLAVSVVDIAIAMGLGVTFALGAREVTLWVWIYLALSFVALGALVGALLRRRRAQKRARAALALQHEVLVTLRARLSAKEKLAALGQLAASVAHEVRNPLAIVRTTVQNLAEAEQERAEQRGESVDDGYAMAIDEIDRLSGVVTSLLDLARPPRLERQPIDARALLDRVELLAGAGLQARGLRLERAAGRADAASDTDGAGDDGGSGGGPVVAVDADLITQVLLGLIDNGAAVSPPGAAIVIDARRSDEGDGVTLSVRDGGPGVDEAVRDKIFEPFFTTRDDGHGLGLAVARRIVEAHDGRIEVGEAAEGGACFVVRLPPGEGARTAEARA